MSDLDFSLHVKPLEGLLAPSLLGEEGGLHLVVIYLVQAFNCLRVLLNRVEQIESREIVATIKFDVGQFHSSHIISVIVLNSLLEVFCLLVFITFSHGNDHAGF